MRILWQCDGFLPSVIGGTEVLGWHLLRRLRERGHEVLVMTPRVADEPSGRECRDGIEIVRLEGNETLGRPDLTAMRRVNDVIAAAVAAFRPDLLHLNHSRSGGFFFFRSGATGHLPRVLTLHSPLQPSARQGYQGRLIAEADRVITVSEAAGATLAGAIPEARAKLSVLRNALPLPTLAPKSLPLQPPRLLGIGRLVVEKGFDTVLRALARLAAEGLRPAMTLAGSGPERRRLELLAQDLDIAGQVQFLGWVLPETVPALLNDASLVVMPSRWNEPFGLVALEAAQMGRPVLASDCGGLPEIVESGRTGLLLPPEDDRAWAEAITMLLADPQRMTQLGAAARQRAVEHFDFDMLVSGYEAIFAATHSSLACKVN